MNDMCEINAKSNDLTLQERIAMLNADQKRIFDKVAHHLLHQKEHEEEKCKCDIKPLQMFISGVGGTGKSFLITPHAQRERGKVIGRGVHIYIYIYIYICLWSIKKIESYFRDRLTFSNVDSRTSR